MQRFRVTQHFSAPVEVVFAHVAEHEQLGPVLGVDVRRVRDGDTSRNGVGSARELRIVPVLPPIEETVTAYVPDELVEYRITRGSPLRDHVGRVRLTPEGTGTRVDWDLEFGAVVPGLDRVVALALRLGLRRGLSRLARRL